MRGLGLKDVRKLDELLKLPISHEAAIHSGDPDEMYDLLEKEIEVEESRKSLQDRFGLSKPPR